MAVNQIDTQGSTRIIQGIAKKVTCRRYTNGLKQYPSVMFLFQRWLVWGRVISVSVSNGQRFESLKRQGILRESCQGFQVCRCAGSTKQKTLALKVRELCEKMNRWFDLCNSKDPTKMNRDWKVKNTPTNGAEIADELS